MVTNRKIILRRKRIKKRVLKSLKSVQKLEEGRKEGKQRGWMKKKVKVS